MSGDPVPRFVKGFSTRHAMDEVFEAVCALRSLKILVVGEAIIDEYSYCTPIGKAPKDPIISAKHVRLERHAGGALACANHVAGLCDDVHLLSCRGGDDTDEAFIREWLRPNVTPHFLVRWDAPTITKRRYLTEGTLLKMFEVVAMDDAPLPHDLEAEMLGYLDRTLGAYDVVIAADYGHGLLGPRVAAFVADRARFLAVNTQANPGNVGFNVVTKYPHVDYVCLDENELRLAMRDRWAPLPDLVAAVRALLKASAVSVTRGSQGVLISRAGDVGIEIPALSTEVVDRMGTGDAYFAITAPCAAVGMPGEMMGLLGSAAAALALGSVGNRASVDDASLRRFLHTLLG